MKPQLPQHIAVVMDGNGRWAQCRGLPRMEGHRAGIKAVKTIVQCCIEKRIKILSLFAFSSENWLRPEKEVEFLMALFIEALQSELDSLHQHEVRLRFTGDRNQLSHELQLWMQKAQELTAHNNVLTLNIAVNYSGKWDILQAVNKLTRQLAEGVVQEDAITEAHFASLLSTNDLPDPDLLIRTSGELRISNFFLWQLAYTELYFANLHWPDFTADEFEKALLSFRQRERRYGQLSAPLTENDDV